MRLSLPEGRGRRIDVLVAGMRAVWLYGSVAADLIGRAQDANAKPPLSFAWAVLALGLTSIELPFLFGVAKGRRWGFIGLAVLSCLGCMGSLIRPWMAHRSVSTAFIIVAIVDAATLSYGLVRLRQGRIARIDVPRTPKLRFADALVGTLGAAWVLGVTAVILRNSAARPIPSFDLGLLGSLALLYVIASIGVGLGRRWGFTAMVVMSTLVLMGAMSNLRRFFDLPEAVIAAFSAVALVYCTLRLHRPNALETLRETSRF